MRSAPNLRPCIVCYRSVPREPGSELAPCAHARDDGKLCRVGCQPRTPDSQNYLDTLDHWTDALDLGSDLPEFPDATQYDVSKPDALGDFLLAYDQYLNGLRDYEDLPLLRSGAV
jgi:hypothetical protein